METVEVLKLVHPVEAILLYVIVVTGISMDVQTIRNVGLHRKLKNMDSRFLRSTLHR